MKEILTELFHIGLIPLSGPAALPNAALTAKALADGGIPCIQIDFNSPAAQKDIKDISTNQPDMLIGAKVTTEAQAKEAVSAGAKFIVTQKLDDGIINYCKASNMAIIPGCSSAADIEAALKAGIDTLNFCPAGTADIQEIKALSAAYPKVKFIMQGGLDISEINKYIDLKSIIACGLSGFGPLIAKSDFKAIEAMAKQAVSTMLGFNLKHVGINSKDEAESSATADTFQRLFGFEKKDCGGAYFNSTIIEVMKMPFYGTHGHIGIATNTMERAVYRFRKAGVPFNEASAGYNDDGSLRVIYFRDEVGGFAVHIVQKG